MINKYDINKFPFINFNKVAKQHFVKIGSYKKNVLIIREK
jgi:hypothetical protein